ncbi:MAG: hypothetical protein IKA74_05750 [Clostridia bacterium]|nr:hypothetical protein [Clostridia bacterium]
MEITYFERVAYREPAVFWVFKERIDTILASLDNIRSIDDIMEVYNVAEYIENVDAIDGMLEQDKPQYRAHLPSLKRKIGEYFNNITANNFDEQIKNMDTHYARDFWCIMCSFKKIDKITRDKFKRYLDENPHHVDDILAQKDLSKRFSDVIYQHLLEQPYAIRFLISTLFERQRQPQPIVYVRQTFSSELLKALYIAYIESEHPHINMLKLLRVSQNDMQVGLDDEVRLMAKRKEQVLIDELSKSASAIHTDGKIGVSFRDADKISELITENGDKIVVYDRRWIYENTDYPTLLNNFIYMFGYTDLHFRSSFPINRHQISALEDVFTVKGIKTYRDSTTFSVMTDFCSLQMRAYLIELQRIKTDIESIFKWFFEDYLPSEFSVTGFSYNIPSAGTSYLEKCKNIASEMERVLKQYRLYSKYGSIDAELFEMSSEHIVFSQLSSLQEKKYVYAKSDNVIRCANDLFSNQMLCFSDDGLLNGYDNFSEALLTLGKIDKTLLDRDFQIEALQRLIAFGAISEVDGFYVINNPNAIILKHLFDKEVLCYSYCESLQGRLDSLISSGDLSEGITLFSVPEQQYLDFILNKATYSDGLDLRNKYSHGTTSTNEAEHLENYLEFLKIMVLIIIKINEEFCLKFPK